VVLCAVLLFGGRELESQSISVSTPIPVPTNKLGQFDAAALSEVFEHLKTVGTAPWTGMQASGTITFAGDATLYNASLTIEGGRRFRLDTQTGNGPLSIRIDGRMGGTQEPDGRVVFLSNEAAASGMFQFPLLRVSDLQSSSSVLDHGMVNSDGATLHRITVERPLVPATETKSGKTFATDFYFDRESHLLVKSVNSITLSGVKSNALLRVITYEDYRPIDGVLIPFRYTEVLGGQKQWALQLSEAHSTANSSSSTQFHF
jgi:hypothetical protein